MNIYRLPVVVMAALSGALPGLAQGKDWTGPYAGIYGEANQSKAEFEDIGCWYACTTASTQGVKAAAGVTIGYDAQVDENFVIGVAGDIGSGFRQRTVIGGIDSPSDVAVTIESKVAFQASVRARAGLTTGNTMIYASVGSAFAKGRRAAEVRDFVANGESLASTPNYSATWNGTASGLILGGGIEHRFKNLSMRIEAVHVQFSRSTACSADGSGPNAGKCWDTVNYVPALVIGSLSTTSVRLGLNFRI
ncbi:MAG: hypothetical protein HOO94_04605 [Novosphingobium sp.]|nr:hypothetical protein [Novosphingobium sp.]